LDYDKQYCIIGINSFNENIELINELYKNERNDFIVLENMYTSEEMCDLMNRYYHNFPRMKCYSLKNTSVEQLEQFFLIMYKSCNNFEFIKLKKEVKNITTTLPFNTEYSHRHKIINANSDPNDTYLEIGIEYGTTFNNVHFFDENKVGVDPDPKFEYGDNVIKDTSDKFFEDCDDEFDVVFIDGMHQCEYILKDINNALKHLKTNGKRTIFIDDILPQNYREQLKIPIKQ
jgi:hypothetical protein